MENLIVTQFSEVRMAPIIADFKTKEYASGITKRQVITEGNLIYLANFRQQHVTLDVKGMERMSFYDEKSWVAQEVEAYLYFEVLNYSDEIRAEKIREQLFYRIIKHKLHIGIKPGAEYEVTIIKENDIFDCLIKARFYSNIFCPDFNYFEGQLDKITEIIEDAISNPNAELTYEDVESFLNDGESRGFYNDEDEDDDDYDDDQDDFESDYRSRSTEEQGYDDYDYLHGGGGGEEEEQDYDEDYHMEQSEEKQNQKIGVFFHYATINTEDNEILLQE